MHDCLNLKSVLNTLEPYLEVLKAGWNMECNNKWLQFPLPHEQLPVQVLKINDRGINRYSTAGTTTLISVIMLGPRDGCW